MERMNDRANLRITAEHLRAVLDRYQGVPSEAAEYWRGRRRARLRLVHFVTAVGCDEPATDAAAGDGAGGDPAPV
jgi:hypothetical protein